jgi:hypothetical protein
MYFSLKYLSFSDAVVLKFIAPILTGFSGVIFLKERLPVRQILTGRKRSVAELTSTVIDDASVWSFCGVILIARPRALFGDLPTDPSDVVSPEQRMISVTSGRLFFSQIFFSSCFTAQLWLASSLRLVHVSMMSATEVCTLILFVSTDTLLRVIGEGGEAHALHINAYFSLESILLSTIGCVPCLILFSVLNGPLVAHSSMIIFDITPVIPRRVLVLIAMFLSGVLGMLGQVCCSIPSHPNWF